MVASSLGLKRAHSPVRGERKSGSPLSVDMPAPVSTTVRREAASHEVMVIPFPSLLSQP
ncbi:hypothetical protein I656_02438 [Geobacillus sp. WSUCF1]|nr:hypothetical protein I656_02438 [Geobacillus sp. WSUCF1]